jgi:chaperonin cofactor prefoldin
LIGSEYDDCRYQLEQLSTDVSTALDKLEGREQQLSSQFQVLLDQYRDSRQQLTDMQEEFSR